MSSSAAIFKRVAVTGLFMLSVGLFAEENPFQIPSTNSFSTNTLSKSRQLKRPEERPREFGIFSPLNTPAPKSFDSGAPSPAMPMISRPAPQPEKDNADDKNKGWIFAKPEDYSADKIFKVKNFGAKENGKERKEQSGFEKFIAGDDKNIDTPGRGKQGLPGANEKNEKMDSRSQENFRSSEFYKEFTSRGQTDGANGFVGRANESASTRASVFGEFFRGDRVAEDRWMQQAMARRTEFQQLFEPKTSTDLTKSALTAATPTEAVAPTEFNRAAASAISDPWKTDLKAFSGPRTSFNDPTSRQVGNGPASSSVTTPVWQPRYQPAVLPFPKRPGELFK